MAIKSFRCEDTAALFNRSPLVWQCIQDYLAGTRLPLSALKAFI